MAQKLQLRRGLEAQRTSITPDVGEPLFTTDNKQFFIGDGATAGGVLIGGGAVGYVLKYRGSAAVTSGADAVTVSGLGLPSAPAQVLVTVRKPSGGLNLFATVEDASVSASGFTADLSAATDGAGYKLDFLVVL
jgi:hypothetical protein